MRWLAPLRTSTGARDRSLDGVRGLAFLLVFLAHVTGIMIDPTLAIGGSGKFGVWLFFVLSGYLLTTYFVARPARATKVIEWVNYVLRRVLRVYPVYVLALLAYWSREALVLTRQDFIDHALLRIGAGHLWTIPVEMRFYVALPVIIVVLLLVNRLSPWLAVALGAVAVVAVHLAVEPFGAVVANRPDLGPYLPVFLVGVTAAFAAPVVTPLLRGGGRVGAWLRLGVLVGALALLVAALPAVREHIRPAPSLDYLFGKSTHIGILWGAVLLVALADRQLLHRTLSTRVLVGLGNISYPAYLVHILVIAEVNPWDAPTPVRVAVAAAITLVVSAVVHVVLERPLSRIDVRRGRRGRDAGAPAAVTAG